jgi:transposase
MQTTTPLDYQELRSISPQAARQATLQILKANKGKVAQTARMLNTTRSTVYKAMAKRQAGDLDDASRSPGLVHNKTPDEIEQKIVALKKKTNYGPLRLKDELWEVYQIELSEHTIRNIVRRNKKKSSGKQHKPHKKRSENIC